MKIIKMRKNRIVGRGVNYEINTPFLIKKKESLKEQRAEYTALRDIIQKRIKRMAASKPKNGINPRQSKFFKEWGAGVPKLREIPEERISYILSAMKQSLKKKESTIKGYQESTKARLRGLQKVGIDFVNLGNLQDFIKFMEEYRAQRLDHVVGSPEAAELYGISKSKGVNNEELFKNFEEWALNRKELERIPVIAGADLSDYQAELNKEKLWQKVKKKKPKVAERKKKSKKKLKLRR